MFIENGDQHENRWVHVRMGYVDWRDGNLEEAPHIFTEVAQDFQEDKHIRGAVSALEGMTRMYPALNKIEYAARLLGWADTTRKKISDTRPFIKQADIDKIVAACIAKMGEVAFSDAYDEGQKMSLDEAVRFALGDEEKKMTQEKPIESGPEENA